MVAAHHHAATEGTVEDSTNIAIDPLNLRVARVRLGLRQRDVAKMVRVAPQRISDFETGVRFPTQEQLNQLITGLGESILTKD